MAQSDQIDRSRKRKLLLDSDIYELDPEDRSPVGSPIGIQLSDDKLNECNVSQESDSFANLSGSVNFDKTVGPGAAPEGFILVDEDLGVVDDKVSRSHDDTSAGESLPIFKVMFRNTDASRKHVHAIKEFLQKLVGMGTKVKTEMDSSGLILEVWDNHVGSKKHFVCLNPESSQETVEDQLFMIDTMPKLKDDLDIPTYGKKFKKVLEKQVQDDVADAQADCSPKLSCFNCLGNHNLRDCTEPRNYATINQNRKLYTAKMGPKNGRYHLEDEQKFGHFVPGQLSKNLRRALGLRDNELPKHIYSMRMLGYPPGWMEEARVQHSGLTLFNSDGCVELDPADEDGEIVLSGERDEFDFTKLCDFPGFNVTPPHGTRDEYKYYGVPRMQEIHSKEAMLSTLMGRKAQDGYKRKKMKVTRSGGVSNSSIVPSEMEVVDVEDNPVETLAVSELFTPPLPQDTPLKPPQRPTVPNEPDTQVPEPSSPESAIQNESLELSSRAISPSLSDLESAKKQLLAELDQPKISLNSSNSHAVLNTSKTTEMPPPSNTELTPQSNRTQSRQSTPKTSNTGTVKSVDLGTPILHSTSPYSKLPASKNFSKDICDIINFENLPDSTGKYEKMSGIILKVRNAVSMFQQE